jgi:hypothetical protein
MPQSSTLATHTLGCSVDRRSGDLAVGGWTGKPASPASELAIYRNAMGQPKFYTDGGFQTFSSCSYDDRGDVFAFGTNHPRQLAELSKRSSTFRNVSVEPNSQGGPVQWDGRHLAITTVYSPAGDFWLDCHRRWEDTACYAKALLPASDVDSRTNRDCRTLR